MIHELKIEQQYLDNLKDGRKKAEIRFNDRDYQAGDILEFHDFVIGERRSYQYKITHIHTGLGMDNGYVVLSVKSLEVNNG